MAQFGIAWQFLLDLDPVFPVIAEVVDVLERTHAAQGGFELDSCLRANWLPIEFGVGNAEALATKVELVQVVIAPAEGDLQDLM